MDLIVDRPSASGVVADYLSEGEASRPFFRRHFSCRSDYEKKAAEVDGRFDREARERAVEGLIVPPGADPARLEHFVEEGGYMVTTGQQPALFGGPLYNIHKALTAVRVAERLESELGKPVLPVFWVASEDHDWAEANHTYVIGVDNELHHLEVAAPNPDIHPALHRVPLGPQISGVTDEFLEHLPETDFSPEYFELIRGGFTAGGTIADGYHATMQQLLGRFGLFFTDAAHPAVKRESAEFLLSELVRAEEMEAVLSATAAELEAAGFELQVPVLADGVNLFLEGPAGRERLYRDADGFHLRTSATHVSTDDVRSRLDSDPAALSPNVLFRPVVESGLFPTLAYIAGPGEMAYFAQLDAYFDAHGIEAPIVFPRFSVTMVEKKIRKVLDKFEMRPDALRRPFHEIAGDIAKDEVPVEVKKAIGAFRGAIAKGVSELQEATHAIDPTLKGPVQHVRSHAFDALSDLERKIVHAVKRENEIALGQLEKAHLHLFPLGKPAERVQNPFYFLARYGGAVLDQLYDAFEVNLD
jgi:bacillithiol synthase